MPRVHRQFQLVCAMLAATVAACWPSVRSLSRHWEDTDSLTYTHGYAIVVVVAWLLWRVRHRIDAQALRPCWPAVPALAAAGACWYLAWASGIQIVHEALLPIMMLGAVAATAGWRIAVVSAFPVGYLYFAIPIWSMVNDELQSLTTASVSLMLRLTGVRAYVEGNSVHIPAGTFEIAGGCSGLHFVIVALAIAALQGEVERARLRTRVVLFAMAGAMAIVTNWIRVYGVILNGYLTDMQGFLVTVDHYYYGWVLFALMMVVYFRLSRRLLSPEPVAGDEGPTRPFIATWPMSAVAATLGALAVAPALARAAERHINHGTVQITLPPGTGGWVGPGPTDTDWAPLYPGADGHALAAYASGPDVLGVYVNAYRYQLQGHEVLAYDNDLLRGLGFADQTTGVIDREPRSYVQLQVRGPSGNEHVVGYFQVIGDRRIDGELASKLYYAVAVLARPTPSGIVAVEARCGTDCAGAERAVRDFLGLHGEALQQSIARSATTP
ncbi:MAG: exosortase A [Steroidobacteraceae bacterium]